MDIIEKLFEMRNEEVVEISPDDKKALLEICPHYYETSELEKYVLNNPEMLQVFNDFRIQTYSASAFFNKKYYLAGLKDGINITKFAKGDEPDDC